MPSPPPIEATSKPKPASADDFPWYHSEGDDKPIGTGEKGGGEPETGMCSVACYAFVIY